ncbi:MAG TPA: ABC transporter substrate-binding protein [Acidimicrobiales bacterium]|jgi:branched-chain amino acid transport system substrate-binding protein|nr:ABC transporter substrate-binding protein [Acidimicrobiales bacterium]
MRQRTWLRIAAAAGALTLVAAACGDDDDEAGDTTETTEEDGGAAPTGDQLVFGRVLPETGPLGFLGPPMIVGTELAVEDINEAGGVLGQDVELLEGDEGETPQIARETVTRLLGEGANAIIGAAASGSSQEFIADLSENQIPQCSGSNTSPAFTDQANADFYFRTVPPDEAVAPIIADRVIADGNATVSVIARADDYGNALGQLAVDRLTEGGATVSPANLISYDPEAATFDAEVAQISGASPDAVVLISFAEGGQIVAGLLEAGITPEQIYGGDGVFGPFSEEVDPANPNVVDGMTVIGAAGTEDFNERIAEPTDNNFIYGGQTYDCVIVTALAAEAAGSIEGPDIIAEIQNVTNDGTTCTSFEECKGLLEDGEDIDYDGASGPINLDEPGDPTAATYAIGQFEDGGVLTILESVETDLAQ